MIKNNERLVEYLKSIIGSFYKILPLYEEEDKNISIYINSLLFSLENLDNVIEINHTNDFITLLSTLQSLKVEIEKDKSEKVIIKREVFKCMNVIKKLIEKIEKEI